MTTEDPLAAFPIGQLAVFVGLTLAASWVWPVLSQAGHLGGFLAGVGTGLFRRARKLGVPLLVACLGLGWLAGTTAMAAPGTPEGYARLGAALLDADRPLEAAEAYDSALAGTDADDERRASWLNNAAYALAIGSDDRADWARGLEMVDRALQTDPGDPNWLDTRGWLLCRLGRVDEGQESLARSLELTEGEPSAELTAHISDCRRD